MDFEPGIYRDLSYEDYAAIPAWRSHDLTTLSQCPFKWLNAKDISESPALLEGRLQHTVFGELHKLEEEFAVEPNVDRRTKAGKEEYAAWLDTLGDRTPIKQDLLDVCMERREVLADFLPGEDDDVELTICWRWQGQPCKGRMDMYNGHDIWDLKTCRDASTRGFRSAINNFKYYQQAAFYLNGARTLGLPAEGFYFLAVEKAHPYAYGVYTLSEEAIAYGDAKNEQALDLGLHVRRGKSARPFNNPSTVTFGVDELY